MRARRIACLILGLWMGAGLMMAWLAAQNVRMADQLMALPNAAASLQFKSVGHAQSALLLRYLAAEQTRSEYEIWETVQLFLSAFFFFFLLFGTSQGKFTLGIALLLFLIVAFQRFAVTPQITGMGRALDFGAVASRREQAQYEVLRYGYLLSEAVKCGLGLVIGVALFWSSGRSLDSGQEIHMIDKADHRHINR